MVAGERRLCSLGQVIRIGGGRNSRSFVASNGIDDLERRNAQAGSTIAAQQTDSCAYLVTQRRAISRGRGRRRGLHFEIVVCQSPVADGAKVKLLLKQLDDENFKVRAKAHEELESLGAAIQRDLEQALEGKNSVEVRLRVEGLLRKAHGIAADVEFLPKQHDGTFMDLANSPDSLLLASVSRVYQKELGRLVVWDSLNTQKPIFSWDGPGLTSVSFSRDGKRLLTSSQDGKVRIWEIELGVGVEVKPKP